MRIGFGSVQTRFICRRGTKKRPLQCCKRAIVHRGTTSVCRSLAGGGLIGYRGRGSLPRGRYPAFDNGRKPGMSLLKARFFSAIRSGGGWLRVFAGVPGCLAPSGSSLSGPIRHTNHVPSRYFFAVIAFSIRLLCSIK